MSLSALEGLLRSKRKAKKPERIKQQPPEDIANVPVLKPKVPVPIEPKFQDNKADDGTQIVRLPRIVPSKMNHAVNKISTGLAMTDPLGVKRETQERREQVIQWMLNGHTHEGQLTSITELSTQLNVPMETIEKDLIAIKGSFEKFYTENNVRDVTALAFMLMEMKLQDRGRALALHNIIMKDISDADENVIEFEDRTTGKKKKLGALTGRDRAAMYSAMLSSLDLANKATNGIDNLIKLSGGFQKLQQTIHAKSVQINNGNGMMMGMDQLQEFAAKTLACVLPSARKSKDIKEIPATLELTEEDKAIMEIGDVERGDE